MSQPDLNLSHIGFRRACIAVILSVAVPACSDPAEPEPAFIHVSGQVLDATTDRPIDKADVAIKRWLCIGFGCEIFDVEEVATGVDGRFDVTGYPGNVKADWYDLSVSKTGYKVRTIRVFIGDNGPKDIYLDLCTQLICF